MDTLPDPGRLLRATQPDRSAECPNHGPFTSRNIIGRIWSKCPVCRAEDDEREAKQKAEEDARRAEERHRQMLDSARIPARFIGRSFKNFVAATEQQRAALTVCRDYAENLPEYARKGSGLILSGKPGTGKSHLTAAILQAHIRNDVRYVTCMDLIRAVRETWRRDSEQTEAQVLRYFERLDLLAIDEVGMQYGTDGEQTILFDILDRRYREMKPTIVITNQDRDGLREFVGDRIFDRLRETARWVAFDWASYRPQARKEAA